MHLLLAGFLLTGCVSAKQEARAASQYTLGTAYYREGSLELSIQTLEQAIKLDPHNWRAQSALGVVYIAKGQPELAEKSLKAAVRMAPDSAEALNNYGTFLLAQGRSAEALKMFQIALNDLEYRNPAMVLSNMSAALVAEGRPEEGLKMAQEAVHRSPGLCSGYRQIGMIEEKLKDIPKAMDAYTQLATACPSEALEAKRLAGCAQMQAGNVDLGVSILEQVIEEGSGGDEAQKAKVCIGGS